MRRTQLRLMGLVATDTISTDQFSTAICNAGYPSMPLPVRTVIVTPYTAGPQPIEIYDRTNDPSDPLRHTLAARFIAEHPEPEISGVVHIEQEFNIGVNRRKDYYVVTLTAQAEDHTCSHPTSKKRSRAR